MRQRIIRFTREHYQKILNSISDGTFAERKKLAIQSAKTAIRYPFNFYVIHADDSIEIYRGTTANARGYFSERIYRKTDKTGIRKAVYIVEE